MNLYPFHEVEANAKRKQKEGWTTHQQFNCSGCGAKQTMPDKNIFFSKGKCEECGHVTNILKDGCNFMATSMGRD